MKVHSVKLSCAAWQKTCLTWLSGATTRTGILLVSLRIRRVFPLLSVTAVTSSSLLSEGMEEVKICKRLQSSSNMTPQKQIISTSTPTCSWSCIYSLQWPETWWIGESHLYQTHRAPEKLERPLHTSLDLTPGSLKTHSESVSQRETFETNLFDFLLLFIISVH